MKRVFIDFDSTLYDIKRLKQVMLVSVTENICKKNKLVYDEVLCEVTETFGKGEIKTVNDLCEFFSKKYDLQLNVLLQGIDNILSNGKKLVYEDSFDFLNYMTQKGYEINILTYVAGRDHDYQMKKIMGTGIASLVDNVLLCTKHKGELGLDYKDDEIIYVDDNPKELISLFNAGVKSENLYRIKRPDAKYSSKEITEYKSKDYENLRDIKIN